TVVGQDPRQSTERVSPATGTVAPAAQKRETRSVRMRGRVTLIGLASFALAAGFGGGGTAAPPSAAARAPTGAGSASGTTLPVGCTHGGAPFHTHGSRGRKRIAIGFDDGPSDYTPEVLRILQRFGSHATFFEIGQETLGRAATMTKILAQGNE